MMKRTLLALIGVFLVIQLMPIPMASAATDRDPLASVADMDQPQLQVSPPDLFPPEEHAAITAVVDEARLFGVPLTVRAIEVPTRASVLPDHQVIAGAAPTGQELVQRIGEEWLAAEHEHFVEQDIEPVISVDESILLMVVVPEDDPSSSIAAFATGEEALPLNGLTMGSLDRILNDVIAPFLQSGMVPEGIRNGISYLSYDNLFGVPARIERTDNQKRLATVTNTALAGGTALSVLGLGALLLWIDRRRRHEDDRDVASISPFEAGALRRGRVDDNVLTGALLHLIQIGALKPHSNGTYSVAPDTTVDDPFTHKVMDRLVAEAHEDGTLPGYVLRHQEEVLAPARQVLKDDLAARGLLHKDARVENVWGIIGCGIVAALALFLLSPGMASLSRLAVFTSGLAFIAVGGAIVWIVRRSWTTSRGSEALRDWQERELPHEDRAIFDLIVHQDALLTNRGGPNQAAPVRMVRQLRALGAG